MNIRRSPFSDMNDIMNDKKGHNIVKDSFAHKPDGLLVSIFFFFQHKNNLFHPYHKAGAFTTTNPL